MSEENKKQDYGASNITVLEGLEVSKKKTGNVYWRYRSKRAYIIWYMKLLIILLMKLGHS